MTVDLVLRNAKVFLSGGIVDAGIAINEERITDIAKETNLPPASRTIDLEGCLVLPGIIDVHVHLRDQGLSYKEDFFTGTAAAAVGGVTSAIDMPNNQPQTMGISALRKRMSIAERKIVINVGFHSAFPKRISDISRIVEEGALSFKFFTGKNIGGIDPYDNEAVLEAFVETAKNNVPVAIHAEDTKTKEKNTVESNNKRSDANSYTNMYSSAAEERGVARVLCLGRESKASIHFCHISSANAARAIIRAKAEKLPVTCEVTPHHLLLSSGSTENIKPFELVAPPLKSCMDIEFLWKALREGYIDVLASDHAPHSIEEKQGKSIWDIRPGISGIETLLPLMLNQVNHRNLSLEDMVRLTSETPAKIFGIVHRGSIKVGNYADLIVVNMNKTHTIESSKFVSKAKYSPFEDWIVKGKLLMTFVNGELVMDKGEIVTSPGIGKIIHSRGRS